MWRRMIIGWIVHELRYIVDDKGEVGACDYGILKSADNTMVEMWVLKKETIIKREEPVVIGVGLGLAESMLVWVRMSWRYLD
jgi:hypothetical protein